METIKHSQVIGHKINRVVSHNMPRVDKYQPRQIFVELDSGVSFHFSQKPRDEPVSGCTLIVASSVPLGAVTISDRASDSRLDSFISSVIGSNDWEAAFGILLENGNVLFQGCNEQEDFLVFSTLTEASVHNHYQLFLPAS